MTDQRNRNMPEIMAPAGSFESLAAAMQAGAGSVYFGAGKLNMRSRSSVNFSPSDLSEISRRCQDHGVRSYLTLNTVIYDADVDDAYRLADHALECGISAVIASDMSVIQHARSIGLEVHLSTQCNLTNREALRFYSAWADVVVLARELTLEQFAALHRFIIEEEIKGPSGRLLKLEIFVHGALCMAVSGKCYMSLDLYNRSANRGECVQPCRRSYTLHDKEENFEIAVENEFLMSPKDLCTIGFLDCIIEAGASVLKIEGRGRSPEYVKEVVCCYKEAAESVCNGTYSSERILAWTERLRGVYNRGFWDGYYLGQTMGEWSDTYGSKASRHKEYIGTVENYYRRIGVAEIRIDTGSASPGEEILIIGPTTGVYETVIKELRDDAGVIQKAEKGAVCSLPVKDIVRRGDKVYKWVGR